MRRLPPVLAAALVLPALALGAPPPALAGSTVLTSTPSPVTTGPHLRHEDFEGSKALDHDFELCGSVSSTTSNACYENDVLEPGMVYTTGSGVGDGLLVEGEGYYSSQSTALVDAHSTGLVLLPTGRVDTVSFDLWNYSSSGTCSVTIAYLDRSAPTTRTSPCPAQGSAPAFVGLEADRFIESITISGTFPTIDDVAFGRRPSNRVVLGSPRRQPATGAATLPVRVPGIGVTTVSGPYVVAGSLDSARARTLVLPVVAKGAARRTLLRTGRVTVLVRVTYRPNGGRAATVSTRVPLVYRR